jgi:hypothetical protein
VNPGEKPERLYFKTYLAMINNSPGSRMFRNFYLRLADGAEFDAVANGQNACAFFVSSLLALFGKVHGIHGTVATTIRDLEELGWQKIGTPQPGDVVLWERRDQGDGEHEHLGFFVGAGRAVSTSSSKGEVAEHDLHFGSEARAVTAYYRFPNW